MKLLTLFLYYLLVTSGLLYSCIQYASDHISKACFSLVAVGILLVLNEVRRNARIVTLYYHCEFHAPVLPDFSTPQPGPAAPGPVPEGPDDGASGEARR